MKKCVIVWTIFSIIFGVNLPIRTEADVPDSQTFVFATNEDIPTLDPAVSNENTAFRVTYVMYDRLVTYKGASTDIHPMLATSWDISEDGRTYTFHLRKDAEFHDGTPVTAEDVRYSFLRMLTIGKGPAGIFRGILDEHSIEALDEHTVRFRLLKEYAPFLAVMATNRGAIVNTKLVRRHEIDGDHGEAWLTGHAAGSGPFMLKEWQRGQRLLLKADKDYWQGAPQLENVVIRVVPEPLVLRMMLEAGEIDMAEGIGEELLKNMHGHEEIVIEDVPGMFILFFALNTSKGPFSDRRVRQAVSQAIDINGILEGVYLGRGIRLNSPVPKGLLGYDENVPLFHYKPEAAKQMLAEAGYADGFSLDLLLADIGSWRQIGAIVQAELAKLNVTVNLKTYAWPTYIDKLHNGEHDLCIMGWATDLADPDQNMYTFLHSANVGAGWNLAFYQNPDVDNLLEEARTMLDPAKRQELYSKISHIAYEDAPYLWITQRTVGYPYRARVKGHQVNPMIYWYIPFHTIHKE